MSAFGVSETQAYNEQLVNSSEKKVQELNSQKEKATQKEKITKEDMKELILQIEILEGEKKKLEEDITKNLQDVKTYKEQIVETQSNILKLQLEIKEKAQESKKKFSEQRNIEIDVDKVLTSSNPVELVDKIYNIKNSVKEDKKAIEGFLGELKDMEKHIEDVYNKQNDVVAKHEDNVSKKKQLEVNLKETSERKEKLGLSVAEIENEIKKINEEREAVIEVINKELEVKENLTTGSLEWPTIGGYISSGQGARVHPITGEVGRFHKGIDIARRDFSFSPPIYAAESGVIVHAGWMDGYGNMVKIKHDDGTLETLYAHLAEIKVSVGQKVRRGQTLGIMGTTGMSTGIHLHFEVYENGELKNPIDYYK